MIYCTYCVCVRAPCCFLNGHQCKWHTKTNTAKTPGGVLRHVAGGAGPSSQWQAGWPWKHPTRWLGKACENSHAGGGAFLKAYAGRSCQWKATFLTSMWSHQKFGGLPLALPLKKFYLSNLRKLVNLVATRSAETGLQDIQHSDSTTTRVICMYSNHTKIEKYCMFWT